MNYKTIFLFSSLFLFSFLINAQPVVQKTIILASDGNSDDMFGYSLSIQGKNAVMGTPQDDDIDNNAGAAYIYKRTNDDWDFKQKLSATDGEIADMFGEAVDIDGDYLVVGAYQAVGITGNTGAAYIYKFNGTNWDFEAKIFADDGQSANNFGKTVAISNNCVVVGAPNEDYGTGAAYIFNLIDETWTQTAKIIENDANISDHFAHSVDIDGNYIVAGAWQNNASGSNSGAAYIFFNNSGTWEQQAKVVASDAEVDDGLGYSVAISGDYIVAGAHADDGSTGSAYVFFRTNTIWEQQAKLTANDGSYEDYFGKVVSISGESILIGSQRNEITKAEEGAAYLYTRDETTWTQQNKFSASDASSGAMFGYCVAIDENYALISSIQVNGAVYVFGPEGVNINDINTNISIYPIPATTEISILNAENYNIKIFDVSGKEIYNTKLNNNLESINLLGYTKGVYLIQLTNGAEKFEKKIIVN